MPAQLEHYYVASAKGGGTAGGYSASAGPAFYEYLNVGSAAYPGAVASAQPGPSSTSLLQPGTAAAVVALQGGTAGVLPQQHHHQVLLGLSVGGISFSYDLLKRKFSVG